MLRAINSRKTPSNVQSNQKYLNIWPFQKVYFHGASSQKRRLGVVESKCIVLMRRTEAAASESGTPGGATLEPHSHTENTSHSVSERLRPVTHLFCSTHGELTDTTHMTWRHQRGIVTPVIVSTRGGELVIADLSLLFKGRMVSSVTQRSLLGPSEWPTGHQLQGFDQRRANEQVSACDQILQFSRVS